MTRIPAYSDGKPTNLQAAILDAMYWLRWLRSQINDPQLAGAGMEKTVSMGLGRAIQALEEFLPDGDLASDGSIQTDLPLS